MATKSEYLTSLENETFIQEVGTEELVHDWNTDIKLKIYKVRLLEKINAEKAMPVNHHFAVYKEGLAGETAFDYSGDYIPYYRDNETKYSNMVTYLEGLSDVYGYDIIDYNRGQTFGKALVYKFVTDHIEEKYYFVYNDSGITHKEITVTV